MCNLFFCCRESRSVTFIKWSMGIVIHWWIRCWNLRQVRLRGLFVVNALFSEILFAAQHARLRFSFIPEATSLVFWPT
jgi:hypothetical protein